MTFVILPILYILYILINYYESLSDKSAFIERGLTCSRDGTFDRIDTLLVLVKEFIKNKPK